jgi:hypothetical protein
VRLGEPEADVVRGQREVGGEGDLAAGAHHRALHQRDDGTAAGLDRRVGGERGDPAPPHPGGVLAGAFLEVRARAEHRALRGDEHDVHRLVRVDGVERAAQLLAHRQVDGVARLGSGELDGRDPFRDRRPDPLRVAPLSLAALGRRFAQVL